MKVTKVNVTNPGQGWHHEPPVVSLYGGGGTGAKCLAHVRDGKVVGVIVVDGGVNYSSAPEVGFDGGGLATGTGTEAYAEVAEGGKPFSQQPVPKPENPPKEAKSTPPVHAESPHEESRPMQSPKPKPTPDETPGQQHTEGGPSSQFNPGGNPPTTSPPQEAAKPAPSTSPPSPTTLPKGPSFQPKPAAAPAPGKPPTPPTPPAPEKPIKETEKPDKK